MIVEVRIVLIVEVEPLVGNDFVRLRQTLGNIAPKYHLKRCFLRHAGIPRRWQSHAVGAPMLRRSLGNH
jgi:hypothetical protein